MPGRGSVVASNSASRGLGARLSRERPINEPSPGIAPSTYQPGHSFPIMPGSRVSRIRTGSTGTNNPFSDAALLLLVK